MPDYINTLIGIFGLLITLFFGFREISKRNRKKMDIIFLKNSSFSLFDSIVKNLDDLEITFQGKKINENLVRFKGIFLNNGNSDIGTDIVHGPLKISLPDNYSWARYKVIDSSNGLIVNSYTKENDLNFEWDLFKKGEYFTFDSLIEYNGGLHGDDNDKIVSFLLEQLKIDHRIKELGSIRTQNYIQKPWSLWQRIAFHGLLLIFTILFFLGSFGQLVFPKNEVIKEADLPIGQYFVTLVENESNSVSIYDKSHQLIMTNGTEIASNKIDIKINSHKKKINYFSLIFFGLLNCASIVFWIVLSIRDYRDRIEYIKFKKSLDKDTFMELEVDS